MQAHAQAAKSPQNTRDGAAGPTARAQVSERSEDEWSGLDDGGYAEENDKHISGSNVKAKDAQHNKEKKKTEKENKKSKFLSAGLEADLPYNILDHVIEENGVDVSEWSSLSLSDTMLAAVSSLGFPRPTPIQSATISKILDGRDVIGKAVTGSGKTLAYGIPVCETWLRLHSGTSKGSGARNYSPIALILSPTRELAHQLAKHISDLTQPCPKRPRVATVTGGLSIHKQLRQLANADIIVGTPGRLWEVINESRELVTGLKKVQFLVVDEADRLLSEGHFKEVEEILDALDRRVVDDDADGDEKSQKTRPARQTLVFSATFHKGLQKSLTSKSKAAAGDLLDNKQSMEYLLKKLAFREKRPAFVDVNPTAQMATALNEAILECGAMEKDLYLYFLLLQNPQAKILVFANSISSVKRVVPLLQNLELPAVALHSTMPQKARLRSLEKFSGQRTVLVATDVAARGLDIKNIDLIIHYHVPRTADMYVHRSGRTARAAASGRSIMLCSPDEVAGVTRLIGKLHAEYQLESIQADRQIILRLRPRLELSQKITDGSLAKEKAGTRDDWLRTAAEELGLDYDSDEFAAEGAKNIRGRGAGKSARQKEAGSISKAEITSMRAQLKEMLQKRINLGVSERYLAGGNVDVDALLEGRSDKNFLARANQAAS